MKSLNCGSQAMLEVPARERTISASRRELTRDCPEFMRSKNLPVPEWLGQRSKIEIPFEKV
jgi:hypothetical protein